MQMPGSQFSHHRSHLTDILYFLHNFKWDEFDGKNLTKRLKSCLKVIKINSTYRFGGHTQKTA